MSILPQITSDRESYRSFLAGLGAETRALLFGATRTTTIFRCPTNGRQYVDEQPRVVDGAVWATCYWCDTCGRVRGWDHAFDRDHGQPHCYPLLEDEPCLTSSAGSAS